MCWAGEKETWIHYDISDRHISNHWVSLTSLMSSWLVFFFIKDQHGYWEVVTNAFNTWFHYSTSMSADTINRNVFIKPVK